MFAVPLQVSPASSSGHAAAISVQNLLDLGADTVLRSRDSCDIRVPKHYVAKFSPALGALIQGASNSTIPTKAEAPLPTVQLPESGATLISLLSFIIPIFPALPPTSAIEATMELLSAAQKYEMNSVLAHIRLCLAQQDPYFIHTDNAFRAYSLAQKYGLRQEAVKAARLTFKFPLALHDLVGRVDIMPGAHLHELWTFHERAQDYIAGGLVDFRNSSASSMLKGLECISCHFSDIPRWVDLYLSRTVVHPSHHDFVRFQKNWARHVRDCECILPEIVGTIWTAINTVVRDNMDKVSIVDSASPVKSIRILHQAEQALSVIGGETDSGIHIGSPTTPLSLSERVDVSQADVIVRSSDHVDFRVHKSILASSSPVFNDMFSLPKPSSNEAVDGLPIVQLSEDAELVRGLLTALYPIPSEMPASYDRILALLAAAQKYDMDTVQLSIRAEISHRQLHVTQAFRTYAIASRWKLIPEMEMAARLSTHDV